ncbi:MAG: hypothetical protein ACK4UR_01900 [Caldimicrobium sp.]
MQRIPLSYVKPGMKTYEEVVDNQGRVLCGKGVEITEEMLKKFQELGVSYVTVEGIVMKFPWEKTFEGEIAELEERFSEATDETLLQIRDIIKEMLEEKHKKGS